MFAKWLMTLVLTGIFCLSGICFAQAADDKAEAQKESGVKTDDAKAAEKVPDEPALKANIGNTDEIPDKFDCKPYGRGLGNWYSLESDINMGRQYAAQIEANVKLVADPVVQEYVNRVGQNLVRNANAEVPFTIKVIDSDEINAMALPGGFFYVNSGLILAADEEAEMAGVMAHEIAHVTQRHFSRQMTRGNWANIASIPLIFVGGGIGYGVRSAAGLALPMTFVAFTRGFEAQADYCGLQYMYKTGYDPHAYMEFFEKIQAREKKKPGTLAKAFSTHPQTPDRIEKTRAEIEMVLPPRNQYIITTKEFDDVKARLAAIENRHKIVPEENTKKPSLRRAKSDNCKADDKDCQDKNDDDRPTLKRREDDK